ncbi:MAG TPA: MIP family channel protein [Candidatus Coprovivens excrementavium]|nr:MIP family channel protein [Candidatus Coprovivens excrementavium]
MIKKFISEFVGTLLLVFFGCGTAVAANKYVASVFGEGLSFNMLLIAFAFGLILMALVYTIGRVSGSHVNPAVSIACLIDGRISVLECVYYIIAQVVGGIAGAMLLSFIFASNASLGANGYGALSALGTTTTLQVALVIELILTFIFVLVVLATTKKENCFSGLAIGLTLTLVHIMGLPFTGTSVNPARSIGPAIITGGLALEQLWVFIVAPIVGGILAALFYKYVIATPETENISLATKTTTTVVVEDEEDEEEPVKEEKATTKKATTKKTTKSTKTDSKKTKKEN